VIILFKSEFPWLGFVELLHFRREVSIMKRTIIPIVCIMVVLAIVCAVFGQSGDSSEEQRRQERRERWDNMSEQAREEFRARMRERFISRREEQLKAIKAIEEQLPKLKESMEGIGREGRPDFREMSPEERDEWRQKRAQAREERQSAINAITAQISVLQGQKPLEEGEELVIVSTGELKAIRKLAVKENATETAERLERISRMWRGIRARPPGPEQRPAEPIQREKKVEEAKDVKKAPEFTIKSFDGKGMSLSEYKGKIVVLEWFNFECPFVKYHYDTVSTMVELADKYKDKNVVWFAINSTSHATPEANREFAQKHKLPYPMLDDRDGKVGRAYGAKTTPHMFVIDAEGNIAYQGAIDNSPMGRIKEGAINYVDNALAELVDGKTVSVAESKPYGCSVKYAD